MRVLLALFTISQITIAQKVGINVPCNRELDGLLTTDPDGDERAFMSCQSVGVGNIGFWERKLCPNNMVFDFINQQCKELKKKARKQQTLSIAILNNSCANGETCIGGSVCDLDSLRCMCPYGTIPKLDTLSCESNQPAFVSATVDGPPQFFNNFGSSTNRMNPFGQIDGPEFKPNTNAYNGNNNNFNWNPNNFNWNGNKQQPPMNNVNPGRCGNSDFSNAFKPNPNQQFVFNFNKNTSPKANTNEPTNKVTTLAFPGGSCKNNELCVGGSICTLPIGICLCPGDLESRDGECVLPAASTIAVSKVGIGALCSDLAECDHGSTCVMGRCTCVSPLVQHEGKCVLRQQQKLVGPGELCDNGEICGKGSVCDVMIPVCVCPAHTDLNNGECISVTASVTQPVMTMPPPVTAPPTTVQTRPPSPSPTQAPTMPPMIYQTFQTTPPPMRQTYATAPPPTPFVPKNIYTAPPIQKPSVKINQMKIGGSKQAGVGVRCSLNTDCMIGAYCNGNTNPPSCQCLSTHVNIEGRCEKVIYPGQVGCRSDLQCHAAYTGTHCIDRICVCPDGQKAVDQTCISESSLPNQKCGYSITNPCLNKSVCFQNTCVCTDRFTLNESNLACEPLPNFQSQCLQACTYPMECVQSSCVCPDNRDCRSRKLLKRRARCDPFGNDCGTGKCIEGVCQCPNGYDNDGKCRQNQCSVNVHCDKGCYCNNGRCVCQNVNERKCQSTRSCPEFHVCQNGMCKCESDEYDLNRNCLPVILNGAFKNINSQCAPKDRCSGGSKCKNNLCQCVDGSIEVSGKCKQFPGGHCSNGELCSGSSQCSLGICRCDSSRIIDNQRCVRTQVAIGSACRRGQDCMNGSACRFGICMCVSKTIAVLGRCVPIADSMSPTTTAQITTEISKSIQEKSGNICEIEGINGIEPSCKATKAAKPSKTVPGSLCRTTSECPFRTKCVEGVCRCKKGETIVDLTCRAAIHQILPGSICDPLNGYDCVGEALCIYGVCKCGNQLASDGSKCVPEFQLRQVVPGKSCRNGETCGGGSYCSVEKICRCGKDEVPDVNKKCVRKTNVVPVFNKIIASTTISTSTPQMTTSIDYTNFVQKLNELEYLEKEFKMNALTTTAPTPRKTTSILAGHTCKENSECPPFSFCFSNVCNCMTGFRAASGYCEAAIPIDGACISSNQCENNSECLLGKCTCIPSKTVVCKDVTIAHPGEDCTSNKKICSFNSYCSLMSGVCECPSGMATIGRSCENTFESIGKDCVTSRNCQKSSYCDNGYCVCKEGYYMENDICLVSKDEADTPSFQILTDRKNMGDNTPLQDNMKYEFKSVQEMTNDGLFETTSWPSATTQYPFAKTFPTFRSFPIAYSSKTVAEEEINGGLKYKISFPGEYCGNGEVCLGNSVCRQQFCRCLQDVSAENGICPPQVDDLRLLGLQPLKDTIRKAPAKPSLRSELFPLENCQDNEEGCVGNSTCRSVGGLGRICQCLEDTVLIQNECIIISEDMKLVAIEEVCDENSICMSGSVCRDNLCQCESGKQQLLGICVQASNPGESCDNGEICINGSICLQTFCQCPSGTHIDSENCVLDRLDDVENENEEDDISTRKIVRRELTHSKCLSNSDCQPHFECVDFACVCDDNTEVCLSELFMDAEYIEVPPGSGCQDVSRKCGNDSICFKNYCVCSYEDMPIDDRCVARDWNIGLGWNCNNQTRCREDLTCFAGKCTCKFGDVNCNSSEPVTSPPGGSCSNLRECTGGSVCREGWCICPDPSMIVSKGICIQSGPKPTLPPKVYQSTPPTVQLPPQVPHQPKVTITKAQQVITPQPHGKKIAPGGKCGPLDSCVGGSTCIEGFCLCPAGLQPSATGRCERITTRTMTTTTTTMRTIPMTTTTSAPPITGTTRVFTVSEMLTTRPPPATIEIPTHVTLTKTSNQPGTKDDECTAIGLICKGNTVCRNKSCQCPDGYVLHHDGCVSPEEAERRRAKKARHEAATARAFARPNESCSADQICVGGSRCSYRKVCECPDEKPLLAGGQCVAKKVVEVVPGATCDESSTCIRGSQCENGVCRCQPGYVAVSGNCVAIPMSTTPKMKMIAKPLESCENGETCDGGSSCDDDTGICMCPPGQIVFNVQCLPPPTQPQINQKLTTPPISTTSTRTAFATDCEKDENCSENKICVVGKCKCRPGFVDNSGTCEPLEDIDAVERPIPVSYAKHKVATLSERVHPKEEMQISRIEENTPEPATPARQETQKPRIVGPPIRRPKPKNKSSSGGNGGSGGGSGNRAYKTGSGNGNCPPGNEPTRDGKRTRMLKYGQPCDRYQDKCINGAKCIDKVCKCAPGYSLGKSGWCEGFILQKAIENARLEQEAKITNPPKANRPIIIIKDKTEAPTPSPQTNQTQSMQTTRAPILHSHTTKRPSTTRKVPKVAAVRSRCDAEDICLGESVCIDGFCRCPENYIEQNGVCISKKSKHKVAKVGQSCKNGEICAGGSICDNDQKKCICAAQHIAINGVCKLKTAPSYSAPGETCSMKEQCTGGSTCFEGMCTCDDHHFAEDGYCRPIEARSSKVHFVNGAGLRRQPPGGLHPKETPQFVILTFDDAVNGKTFPDYKDLFEHDVIKNPNGCDVKATFFISHEWTNYDAVNWLVQKNMEIASNSISHMSLEHEDTNRWLNEMDGQRRILAKFGGVPEESIIGIRAPQLALGGDDQFEMMSGAGFVWDNSMSANPGINGDPYWPQTLDYAVSWPCFESSCPKSSFNGVWTIPLNQFYGSYMPQIDSFRRSSMLRAAVDLNNTVDELEEIIMRNFERSYSSNRAPYVLSLNADFLQLGGEKKGMKALKKFMNYISTKRDVYIVTMKQLIDWMQHPVPLNQMQQSKAVECPISFNRNPGQSSYCEKPNKCLYSTPSLTSQEHQFLTCLPCPTMYPWVENPAGAIV
ncbi:unnamed protein product [Caenorhabditis bovis]|uniref:EGF-like domain-containing protein n=1 Tax=Caenorhabditis bovis TaxID=2654633 RepID=A0A8S1ESI2_9PELO|nr:unnamed protein product [Caenorhabditis bovis]